MDLTKYIKNAVLVRELDLSELDEAYKDDKGNPLRLLFRVNPSRGQVALQYGLSHEYGEIQNELEVGKLTPELLDPAVELLHLRVGQRLGVPVRQVLPELPETDPDLRAVLRDLSLQLSDRSFVIVHRHLRFRPPGPGLCR